MISKNVNGLRGTRILVVDDDDFNLDLAQIILESVGVTVSLASNGHEALTLLRHGSFDCVLMDHQMPVMNGIEATLRIRSDPALSDTRIIAVTSDASTADRERYLSMGMNEVVGKPYTAEHLLEVLTEQLCATVD